MKSCPHQIEGVLPLVMDVRKLDEVKQGIALAAAKFGRVDIAVNNAGVGGQNERTHELDEDEWQRVIDINLNGVYRCQKEELAVMIGQEYVPDFFYSYSPPTPFIERWSRERNSHADFNVSHLETWGPVKDAASSSTSPPCTASSARKTRSTRALTPRPSTASSA